MTAKICSILKKIICGFFLSAAFCEGSFSEKGAAWTLAAERFSLVGKNAASPAAESASKALPSLVLEQLAENLFRTPPCDELLDRRLYEFKKERLSLFLQLSKEVQARDSLVLSGIPQKRLEAKIKGAERKISEVQDKIGGNLAAESEERERYASRIGSGDGPEIGGGILENVALYQNDFSKLFDAGAASDGGYQSYAFEKACINAGVSGLLSGTISIYGSYMSVAAVLYRYPGAREIARAVEVGQADELKRIAAGLSAQLAPKITDSMPVELTFSIQPEDAAKNAVVTIDDVVYKGLPESLTVAGGVHTVMFSAGGFASASTSYSFSGNRRFHISAALSENSIGAVNLRLKKMFSGEIYANGLYSGSVGAENRFSSISINGAPVLGHFVSEDGTPADFYVPQNLLSDGAFLKVDARPFDRSEYIDKRRRWMYASYSALIVSLIPAFYTYGNYYAAANSYNSGLGVSYEEAKGWQLPYDISVGISVSCGVFFIYELVRYLRAANNVLPAFARPLGKKERLVLEGPSVRRAVGAEKSALFESSESSERKEEVPEGE